MAIKVDEHLIPDWAIERQSEALFENVARGMPGKPREVVRLAALDVAKDRLIDQALMAQESSRRKYKVDEVEVKREMKQWMKQNGGKKAFEKANHPLVRNSEDLRKEVLSRLRFNQLLEEESACEAPAEEEARAYYEDRPDLFTTEVTLRASHWLKRVEEPEKDEEAEKAAREAKARVDGGEDFVEVVRLCSDCPEDDGSLGLFGRGKMVPEFEKVAFALQAGEVSEPVRTQFGWHLILLHERNEPETTPFEEVQEQIISFLHERRKDEKFDAFLDSLKAKAEIEEVVGLG